MQSQRAAEYRAAVGTAIHAHKGAMIEALARFEGEADRVAEVAAVLMEALRSGNKILIAGNGGSAAEAQHFSAELVGRFRKDSPPYAALALTTDTSILTAVANDYRYCEIFARQVLALGQQGDVLLAFSTSGESENLMSASQSAHACGMQVIAVTGNRPSRLEDVADVTVRAPSDETPIVQELHMALTHLLCGLIEEELSSR